MTNTVYPETEAGGISRRALIGKAAVVGITAWSIPVLVSSTAHAAGSDGQSADGPIDCVRLTHTGDGWITTYLAGSPPAWYDHGIAVTITVLRFGSGVGQVLVPGQQFDVCNGDQLKVEPVETSGPTGATPDEGPDAPEDTEPSTEPTTPPSTEPTTPPSTESTAPPSTEPTAPPSTEPTAPPSTEAPTEQPATSEPAAIPALIQFDWSADSEMTEGDRIGPFVVAEVTYQEV